MERTDAIRRVDRHPEELDAMDIDDDIDDDHDNDHHSNMISSGVRRGGATLNPNGISSTVDVKSSSPSSASSTHHLVNGDGGGGNSSQ